MFAKLVLLPDGYTCSLERLDYDDKKINKIDIFNQPDRNAIEDQNNAIISKE